MAFTPEKPNLGEGGGGWEKNVPKHGRRQEGPEITPAEAATIKKEESEGLQRARMAIEEKGGEQEPSIEETIDVIRKLMAQGEGRSASDEERVRILMDALSSREDKTNPTLTEKIEFLKEWVRRIFEKEIREALKDGEFVMYHSRDRLTKEKKEYLENLSTVLLRKIGMIDRPGFKRSVKDFADDVKKIDLESF